MTNLLCLDLATQTGWARIKDGEIAYGTLRLPKTGRDVGRFLAAYWDWANAFFDGYDVIAHEAPFAGNSQDAARKLLCLAGTTELICHRKGIRCTEANTNTVVKHFCGRCPPGRAEKKAATMKMCKVMGWDPQTEDEADAIALLSYAVHWLRLPVKLPAGPLFSGEAA